MIDQITQNYKCFSLLSTVSLSYHQDGKNHSSLLVEMGGRGKNDKLILTHFELLLPKLLPGSATVGSLQQQTYTKSNALFWILEYEL